MADLKPLIQGKQGWFRYASNRLLNRVCFLEDHFGYQPGKLAWVSFGECRSQNAMTMHFGGTLNLLMLMVSGAAQWI